MPGRVHIVDVNINTFDINPLAALQERNLALPLVRFTPSRKKVDAISICDPDMLLLLCMRASDRTMWPFLMTVFVIIFIFICYY